MNFRSIVFLCLLIFSNLNFAQYFTRIHLDSLVAAQQGQDGTQKIKTLLTLSESYQSFQLDTAKFYLDLAQQKAVNLDYKWGICKSHLIESNILFRQGHISLEEVKFIKLKCINWFERNNFARDGLMARMSRNKELMYNEGKNKAFENAKLFLKLARQTKDSVLLAQAWAEINNSKDSFFNETDYPNSRDSLLFYLNQTNDSLNILYVSIDILMTKWRGQVPLSEITKLEEITNRWMNPLAIATVARVKSYKYVFKGDIDSSTYYIDKINDQGKVIGDEMVFVGCEQLRVMALEQANELNKAIDLINSLRKINEELGIQTSVALDFQSIGENYFSLKEYDLAISNFLESMYLYEKLEDDYKMNSVKRRLADLYVLTDENGKAENLYHEVIEWAKLKQELLVIQIMLANANQTLASLYQKEKKYDKALLHYEYSFDNLKNARYRLVEPKVCLMSMYLDMNDIEKADSLYLEITSGDHEARAKRLEEFYLEEGRLFFAKNENNRAVKSFTNYLNFGISIDITKEKKEANLFLYKAYKKLGKSDEALKSFEAFKQIEDSLELSKTKENVQKIQSDYELSLKESEIERLEQKEEISQLKLVKQENQLSLRTLYITLLIFTLLILAGLGYIYFKRFQLKKDEEKSKIKKELEIENLKSKQKTELAEVKNRLYANISHEFKTPLTLIQVPLQELKEKAHGKEKVTYASILRNTDYLLEMLDELLGVSNIESDKIELHLVHFDLAHLLSRIKLNFAPLFSNKNIEFIWEVNLNEDSFYGDENRLSIVINNLLKNAFSHSESGGWIKCEVRLDNELIINVSNNGKQISAIDLPHIFKRFYRSKDSEYSGSGIGLAWSKQIVELHNGNISANNSREEEVIFTVNIPVAKQELNLKSLSEKKNLELNPTHNSELNLPHILVVEDNLEMQKLLSDVLKKKFRLDFAENGEIGEEKAIQLQPDLVLSDVMMPKKDGFELLKALKENFKTSHIPVVLLTARGDSDSRVIGLNQDADDYIGKPFKSSELIARINNLLRQRIHLHELFSENPFLYSKEIKCTPIDADFIDRARKILTKFSADGDFSVNEFCRELALNKTSVNYKLKALTNQTIAEYIKNFRLEKAVKLLIETNLGVSEISTDTGFNNTQVFNRAFKKKFKQTPSEYRSNLNVK